MADEEPRSRDGAETPGDGESPAEATASPSDEESSRSGGAPESADDGSSSASVLAGAVRHGVLGADSWALRTYAVVGSLVAVFTAALVVFAIPGWAATTAGGGPLERVAVAFLALLGLLVVATAFLPLLLVDRRRRAGRLQHQRAFGLAGWWYVCSLYLALLASAPADLRSEPGGPLAPIVEALYALPPATGVGFPVAALAVLVALEYGLDRQ